jgi:hypothetical protein
MITDWRCVVISFVGSVDVDVYLEICEVKCDILQRQHLSLHCAIRSYSVSRIIGITANTVFRMVLTCDSVYAFMDTYDVGRWHIPHVAGPLSYTSEGRYLS